MIDFNAEQRAGMTKALEHSGKERQLRKLQEECCELGAAINHYLNGRAEHGMYEEIADVIILLEQALVFLPVPEVERAADAKLKRMREIVIAQQAKGGRP